MRYSADHKEQTRQTVLAEAGKAIRKDGPQGVSVAEVMKRAGLTHGGFYAHFKSKDAMLAAAIEQMFESARDRWHKLTEGLEPREAFAKYVDWYLSKEHRDAREVGCTVAALASDLPRLSAQCQKAYAAGARRMTDRFAGLLEQLGHGNNDDKLGDRTAEELAVSVVAELVGTLSLARAEPDAKRSDAILRIGRESLKSRLT